MKGKSLNSLTVNQEGLHPRSSQLSMMIIFETPFALGNVDVGLGLGALKFLKPQARLTRKVSVWSRSRPNFSSLSFVSLLTNERDEKFGLV